MSINPVTLIPATLVAPNGKHWPRGFRLGNPCNMDWTPGNPWQGLDVPPIEPRPLDGTRPRFCKFKGAVWGGRAAMRNLITYQDVHGVNTIQGIINRWAPAKGKAPDGRLYTQDTQAYIDAVCKATGFERDQQLNLQTVEHNVPVVKAMCRHELGNPTEFGMRHWYPDAMWNEAATRAGLLRAKAQPVTQDPELVAGGSAAVLAGISAADALGVAEKFIAPGSWGAALIGVLAVVAIAYLVVHRVRKRQRDVSA